jgi:mercuric reductase
MDSMLTGSTGDRDGGNEVNETREVTVEIRGMTCDHCERTVANALQSVPGVAEVLSVSSASGLARLAAAPEATAERIEGAVARAGYRARVREARTGAGPAVLAHADAEFDLVIVGGGSAGFAAAIKGAELGARVAMAEAGTLGGTCVNVGCVPSKTLIRAAEANHRRVEHGFAGIPATDGRPDWERVRRQKDDLVAQLRQAKYWDVLRSYEAITLFEQRATFSPGRAVRLADGRTLTAGKIVVTTGASPWAPPIPGLAEAGYLDNASAMALDRLPSSLVVIGASAVGLELAQLFARLCVNVSVLEALPRVLPAEDPDIGTALGDYLRAQGLQVHAGLQIEHVGHAADGYTVTFTDGGTRRTARAEQLLVATGRRANTTSLGLETVGVRLGTKREIVVDEFLQTANPDVYAAGDVLGDPMFVYVAAYGGTIAAENALTGNGRRYDLTALPRVTFTDPAVASVGLTEDQARARGIAPLVSKLPLEHVPRSLAARETRGFVKLLADSATRRIIGAHILATEAGEMITEPALATKFGLTIEDLTSTFHPYLTLSEGIKLAAQAFSKDVKMLSCCAA